RPPARPSLPTRRSSDLDLAISPLDSADFKRRFGDMVIGMLEAYRPRTDFKLALGNEVDNYLGLHPEEVEPLQRLLVEVRERVRGDRKSTRLNSSHLVSS